MDFIQIISAAGIGGIIGSLLTTLVQFWLANKASIQNRNFEQKKEAYLGLLDSYHKAAVNRTQENGMNFAYWQMRCDLVSPKDVRNAIQAMIDSEGDLLKRTKAQEELKRVLRRDLGVDLSD